jgi:signal recognition particle receptor subunit beta
MEVKLPKTFVKSETDKKSLSISLTDIPGHFNFRLKVSQYLEKAKAVIVVLDSKDKHQVSEAADFIYDVITNQRISQESVPILVVCNK